VLNVVNPPQKPTVNANLQTSDNSVLFIKYADKKPIIKLPSTFAIKVDKGKHGPET